MLDDYVVEQADVVPQCGAGEAYPAGAEPVEQNIERPLETRFKGSGTTGEMVVCAICGYAFAKRDCVRRKGRYYCRSLGCDADLEVLK